MAHVDLRRVLLGTGQLKLRMARFDAVEQAADGEQGVLVPEGELLRERLEVLGVDKGRELAVVLQVALVDVVWSHHEAVEGRPVLGVEIVLDLLQVQSDGAVVLLLDVGEVDDVAEAVGLPAGAPVGTVNPADGLEQGVLVGLPEQVHLLQAVDVVPGRQHLVDDEDVGLQGLLEGDLGALVHRRWDVPVADDKACLEPRVLVEPALYLLGLRVRGANDHAADGVVGVDEAEVQEVLLDVGAERLDVVLGLVDVRFVRFGVLEVEVSPDLGPGSGLDGLLLDPQRVAVGDGLVVEVLVDVVAELEVRALLLGEERRAGQRHVHRVGVHEHEVLVELAVVPVASVRLVDEHDALHLGAVLVTGDGHVVGELLDVHHRHLAVGVHGDMARHGLLELALEGRLAVHVDDVDAALRHLAANLREQVEAVDDVVEAGGDALLGVPVAHDAGAQGGELGLARALRVPDDSGPAARLEAPQQRPGGEELRVAHDVLLRDLAVDVENAVMEDVEEPLLGEHRGDEPVAWGVRLEVRAELRRVGLRGRVVVVLEDRPHAVDADLGEVADMAALLAEERERGLLAVWRRVEGARLDILGERLVVVGLILHVVGERHYLEHVEVLAPLGLLEPLVEHALELRLDAALVVGWLHLEEGERDAVDKDVHVRPERPLALLAEEQFGDDGEVVGVDVGEVDESGLVLRVDQPAVERLSHVVVADDGVDLGDELDCLPAGVLAAV